MITKEQAMALAHGATIYSTILRGKDKRPVRVRVNGKCRTWRRGDHFELPVKFGMYRCFIVTPEDQNNWSVDEAEAAKLVEAKLAAERAAR